jgi:hypothetical protein
MASSMQQQEVNNGNNNRIVAVNVTPSGTPSHEHDFSKPDQVLIIFSF